MRYLIVVGDISPKEYSPVRAAIRFPSMLPLKVHRVPTVVLRRKYHISHTKDKQAFIDALPFKPDEIFGVVVPEEIWNVFNPAFDERMFEMGDCDQFPNLPHVSIIHRRGEKMWIDHE